MSVDITFITNELGNTLRDRFAKLLGTDARLLTDGEEIKSHDLFDRLNSKVTITGEAEQEETELKYLTEIREIRDKQPDLFARIKQLPKKARSTRLISQGVHPVVPGLPALLTYLRQGRLDKFYICTHGGSPAAELDFMAAARVLKPANTAEPLQPITGNFYDLLDKNMAAFREATDDGTAAQSTKPGGGNNAAYILKRLTARDIRDDQGYTDDDEAFIKQVIQLLDDGALPKITAKQLAQSLKKVSDPLKVLSILRTGLPASLLQPTRAQESPKKPKLREVILSSFLPEVP